MVYTDGKYLIADSVRELQDFASLMGLAPEYLNGGSYFPHYKIPENSKKEMLEAGVRLVSEERLQLIAMDVFRKGGGYNLGGR